MKLIELEWGISSSSALILAHMRSVYIQRSAALNPPGCIDGCYNSHCYHSDKGIMPQVVIFVQKVQTAWNQNDLFPSASRIVLPEQSFRVKMGKKGLFKKDGNWITDSAWSFSSIQLLSNSGEQMTFKKDCCAWTHNLLCERQRFYHFAIETQLTEKAVKLILIHASDSLNLLNSVNSMRVLLHLGKTPMILFSFRE